MNIRDRKKMVKMAEQGQFQLMDVTSQSLLSVRFVTGIPSWDDVQGRFMSLRNPRRDQDLSRLSHDMQVHVNTGDTHSPEDYVETDMILRKKFAEFVKTIDPKLFELARDEKESGALHSAENNLLLALRTFIKRGGSWVRVHEIVSQTQVEEVHEA